jgi:hypothetical protein
MNPKEDCLVWDFCQKLPLFCPKIDFNFKNKIYLKNLIKYKIEIYLGLHTFL